MVKRIELARTRFFAGDFIICIWFGVAWVKFFGDFNVVLVLKIETKNSLIEAFS
jgi:hypothetical protein